MSAPVGYMYQWRRGGSNVGCPQVMSCAADTAGNISLFCNGVADNTYNVPGQAFTPNGFGSDSGGASEGFVGYMQRLVAFNAAMSMTNRQGIEAALMARAGLPVTVQPIEPSSVVSRVLDVDMSNLALADGATVSSLTDVSGTCTVSAANPPTYRRNVIGGLGAVQFTATDGSTGGTGFAISGAPAFNNSTNGWTIFWTIMPMSLHDVWHGNILAQSSSTGFWWRNGQLDAYFGGDHLSSLAGTSYPLTNNDDGATMDCQVTAWNTAGETAANSNSVGPVIGAVAKRIGAQQAAQRMAVR